MQIHYTNRYSDYLLFTTIHQFLSPFTQFVYCLIPGLIASIAWSADTRVAAVITGILAYVLMWLFQLVFTAIYLYSRHDNRTLLTTHRIELQEEGLLEESPFNRTLAFWPGIIKAVARPGFLGVYVAAHQAYIIPKRAFASPDQEAAFLRALRENIARHKTAGQIHAVNS